MIWVTGFPRTGTTFTLLSLLKSPDVGGLNAEVCFETIWETANTETNDSWDCWMSHTFETSGETPIFWLGAAIGKTMLAIGDPVRCLDQWAPLAITEDKRCCAIKRPMTHWPLGWPIEYCSRSAVFDAEPITVVCRRDFDSVWESSMRHFPHWSVIDKREYQDEYNKFYGAVPDGAIVLDHDVVSNEPRLAIQRLCQRCDIRYGGCIDWRTNAKP